MPARMEAVAVGVYSPTDWSQVRQNKMPIVDLQDVSPGLFAALQVYLETDATLDDCNLPRRHIQNAHFCRNSEVS